VDDPDICRRGVNHEKGKAVSGHDHQCHVIPLRHESIANRANVVREDLGDVVAVDLLRGEEVIEGDVNCVGHESAIVLDVTRRVTNVSGHVEGVIRRSTHPADSGSEEGRDTEWKNDVERHHE
jgi:hypothetical protein